MTIGEWIEVAFLTVGVGGGALWSLYSAARWLGHQIGLG